MENQQEVLTKTSVKGMTELSRKMGGTEPGTYVDPGFHPTRSPGAEDGELPATNRQLEAAKRSFYDRLLRVQAELENVPKRTEREKEEFALFGSRSLRCCSLPPVP